MSALVEATTPVAQLDESAARELVDSIKSTIAVIDQRLIRAYQGRAWLALGYGTWNEMCDAEFRGARVRLPREDRQELHADMAAAGMSTRAIAAATGVDRKTVMSDLQVVQNGPPAPISPGLPDEIERQLSDFEAAIDEAIETATARLALPDDDIVDAEKVDEPVDAEIIEPRITGMDGKSYPARPAPRPITSADFDEAEAAVEVVPLGHLVPPTDDRAEAVAVVEAFAESLTTDADRINNAIKAAVNRLHAEFISNHTAESLVDVFDADDLDDLCRFADLLIERVTAIREAQPGLRLVQGGHR